MQRPTFLGMLLPLSIEFLGAGFEEGHWGCLEDAAEIVVVARDLVEVGVYQVHARQGTRIEQSTQVSGRGSNGVEFVVEGLLGLVFGT